MARKRNPAAHAAVLEAALKIAQEHARIIEAANHPTGDQAATIPAPRSATK